MEENVNALNTKALALELDFATAQVMLNAERDGRKIAVLDFKTKEFKDDMANATTGIPSMGPQARNMASFMEEMKKKAARLREEAGRDEEELRQLRDKRQAAKNQLDRIQEDLETVQKNSEKREEEKREEMRQDQARLVKARAPQAREEVNQSLRVLDAEIAELKNQLAKKMEPLTSSSLDPLEASEALFYLMTHEGRSPFIVAIGGVLLVFLIFDIAPMLMKMTTPIDEYEKYIARKVSERNWDSSPSSDDEQGENGGEEPPPSTRIRKPPPPPPPPQPPPDSDYD